MFLGKDVAGISDIVKDASVVYHERVLNKHDGVWVLHEQTIFWSLLVAQCFCTYPNNSPGK